MDLHLDPLGGIAGDMFLAALLDARPDLAEPVEAAMRAAGLPDDWGLAITPRSTGGFAGTHLAVIAPDGRPHPPSGRFREIRARIRAAALSPAVAERAIGIYALLAEAEGAVHGMPADEVHFHEIADWDSLADIVGAAAAIEALDVGTVSVGSLPLGGGVVRTQHGPMPVPGPATARLLAGWAMHDDGVPGERVTPTGAAILRHLDARQDRRAGGRLLGAGTGVGTRQMRGIANMLRVLLFEPDAAGRTADSVGVIAFEIDDQTGEELAVGLDRLRGLDGVLDVTQWAVHGKKGRMAVQVQVLCRPDALDAVIERCFLETTTIGLRHRVERRVLLPREAGTAAGLAVKRVVRPGGIVTAKPEMDALGAAADNQPERARLRRRAEEDGDG